MFLLELELVIFSCTEPYWLTGCKKLSHLLTLCTGQRYARECFWLCCILMGLCQCKKAVAPPVHVHRPYMFTTSTCSLPVHVHHRCLFTIQYMFIHQCMFTTSTSPQPVHVHHQCTLTTSACSSSVHHQYMFTTSTFPKPAHVHHQYMLITSTFSPPVHVLWQG